MKCILVSMILLSLASGHDQGPSRNSGKEKTEVQSGGRASVLLVLPSTLENRRAEFLGYVHAAKKNILEFSKKFGWEALAREEFFDRVMIFDYKNNFNTELLKLAGADPSIRLPDTYCAALEKRTLVSVTPEFYAKVYPEGIEERSFEKLLTHEIAHRLHVRILHEDEAAMGPLWFYEGFAMYAADQFSKSDCVLGREEMAKIMNDPDRGGYLKYNFIFRFFAGKVSLRELIRKAKNENFNEELILMVDGGSPGADRFIRQ